MKGKPATVIAKQYCWIGSGVKDSNGKEIFEGDIIKFPDNKRYTIEFQNGMFFIGNRAILHDFCLDPQGIEVVGHITEEDV